MGTRVVVAEDSYLIREGLRMLFDSVPGIDLVSTAGTLPELFDAVEAHEPDVVVTDIRMPPTGYEGVRAAEELARTRPDVGVVVLSQYVETDVALRVFDGGAKSAACPVMTRCPPCWFDPDRFVSPSAERAALARAAWVPFGRGARICIGFALAQMELMLILARFAQRLDIEPTAAALPKPVGMVVNRPAGGALLCITARA